MFGPKFTSEFQLELKKTLINIVDEYMCRNRDDVVKFVVFTDENHSDRWSGIEGAIVITEFPLPPVPEDYSEEKHELYIDRIANIIFKYMLKLFIRMTCAIYDSGNASEPHVHLVFSNRLPLEVSEVHQASSVQNTTVLLLSRRPLRMFTTIGETRVTEEECLSTPSLVADNVFTTPPYQSQSSLQTAVVHPNVNPNVDLILKPNVEPSLDFQVMSPAPAGCCLPGLPKFLMPNVKPKAKPNVQPVNVEPITVEPNSNLVVSPVPKGCLPVCLPSSCCQKKNGKKKDRTDSDNS